MKKNQLCTITVLIAVSSVSLLAFSPKKKTDRKKPLYYLTREIVYTGAGTHASLYKYIANDFTGATWYDWTRTDGSGNLVIMGSHSATAIHGGDNSCDNIMVYVNAYTSMGGTLVARDSIGSDLCVPYDVFSKISEPKVGSKELNKVLKRD